MSVEAISWALRQTVGDTRAKAVLVVLAGHADEEGRAILTRDELARISEITVEKLADRIEVLVARGLVRRSEDGLAIVTLS